MALCLAGRPGGALPAARAQGRGRGAPRWAEPALALRPSAAGLVRLPRARPCVRGVVCVCQGHTLPEARCVSLRFMDHAPRPLRLLRENLGSDPRSGPGQAQARHGPRTRPSSPALPGLSLCSGPGTAGARRRPEARGAGEGAGARRPVSRKQERGLEIGKAEAKPIRKEIDVKPRDKITLNEIKKEIYQRHQRCSSEYGPGKGNAEDALRGEGRGRGGGGGGWEVNISPRLRKVKGQH